jgi:signal transduction histidine kinase
MLAIEVDDDGVGPVAWTPGVGLLSMREQAEELGGSIQAGPCDGGALVRARYPIAEARA